MHACKDMRHLQCPRYKQRGPPNIATLAARLAARLASLTDASRHVRCAKPRQREPAQRRTRVATTVAASAALATVASVGALTLATAVAGIAAIAAVDGVSALALTAAIAGIAAIAPVAAIAALVAIAGVATAAIPSLVQVHASLPQRYRSRVPCEGVQEAQMQIAAQAESTTCLPCYPIEACVNSLYERAPQGVISDHPQGRGSCPARKRAHLCRLYDLTWNWSLTSSSLLRRPNMIAQFSAQAHRRRHQHEAPTASGILQRQEVPQPSSLSLHTKKASFPSSAEGHARRVKLPDACQLLPTKHNRYCTAQTTD